jgi:hypothetical protein
MDPHSATSAAPAVSPEATAGGIGQVASLDGGSAVASSRLLWAEYLTLALLLGLFFFRGLIPGWRSLNSDFRNYYVAARLYREETSLLRVYDFTWFQRQKDHLGIQACLVGFVPDTLLSALPIVPLAGLPPLTAKRCWLAINAAFLALCVLILMQITQLGWRRLLIVVFLAIEPLAKSFVYGQMHLAVLLLLAAAAWCSERRRPALAGILVALAAGLKLYPALFLVFFIRKKQWRAVGGTAVGLIALAGLSVYLFGWDAHRIYVHEILPAIGRGENINPYAPGWNSLTALLHRAFIAEPQLNPHPLVNAPSLYALVQPLCQAAIFIPAVWLIFPGTVPRSQARLEWAAFTTMLIALSTGPTTYHLCVLILAAALALDSLLALGRRWEACAVVALYGMVCFPLAKLTSQNAEGWNMFLASPRVYPMLALLGFLYAALFRIPLVRARMLTHRREIWAFGAAVLLLSTLGAFQNFRHERGEFDNYRHRLLTLQGSLLDGEPAVGADGLYFTSMRDQSSGFEAWRWSERQLASLPQAEDEFHPTTAAGLADVWVELSGPASNIVRFSRDSRAGVVASRLEVANGEQPDVSPDGKWLAFIRETHGRGALWLKAVGSPLVEERKIVDDSYDVWDAAIAPGGRRIVFAAAEKGQPELYSADVATGRVERLPIGKPARYPALSPNGKWIAYSRCEQGTWQLYVTDLAANSSHRVPGGDCNSISPAWEPDSKHLIYATDCGRGLEMTALARVNLFPEPADAEAAGK